MSTLLSSGEGSRIERTVLPGGIRVITETVPGLQSETVGVWVGSGSRHEPAGSEGSTHFLEHMLFKGTSTRTAREIASGLERTGGDSNALTAKEHTCYYARCLVSDLDHVSELLWDMVLDSQLDAGEFERERGVIIEELAMAADDPTDQLYEDFEELVWSGQALGRPVGATKEQIRTLDHAVLLDHYSAAYAGPGLVFAAAGGASHAEVVDQVARHSAVGLDRRAAGRQGAGLRGVEPQRTAAAGPSAASRARFTPGLHVRVRETEQQGLLLGAQGLPDGHEKRFPNIVLANLLGGGMSSRLFQVIREERGLAYTVHTVLNEYSDAGTFAVYAGCAPEAADEVLALTAAELARAARETAEADEVADIVAQLAGSTVLGMESTAVRMNRIARHELTGLPLLPPEELISRVRAVTPGDVRAHAEEIFSGPWALAAVGPRADLSVPAVL
ncbi:M16 family metallopeptidase [Brevibacterium album]|uniref:M16 family metallopeptidase n=1 Tax=Brevibacterium album TaxID=417948 RepID=UPI0004207D54|nr:pitrilysin family protein [Brevibacterium album]